MTRIHERTHNTFMNRALFKEGLSRVCMGARGRGPMIVYGRGMGGGGEVGWHLYMKGCSRGR